MKMSSAGKSIAGLALPSTAGGYDFEFRNSEIETSRTIRIPKGPEPGDAKGIIEQIGCCEAK